MILSCSEIVRNILFDDLRWYDARQREAEGDAIGAALEGRRALGKRVLLPIEDLLKLEAVVKEPHERVYILSQLVRQKPPIAVDRFLKDLGDPFVYGEFRDAISPDLAAAIRPHIDKLSGKAKNRAQLLMYWGERTRFRGFRAARRSQVG